MKAKYFRTCGLLDATLGSRPSLTWRGIWSSLDTLAAGLRWRIGNGRTVKIWGDNWLPRSGAFRVSSPWNTLPRDATVSFLIDDDLNTWNRELVETIFWEEEAKTILSIPIGNRSSNDKLLWHHDRTGYFTVKTAYKVHQEKKKAIREAEVGGPSAQFTRNWSWIWRTSIPPKIRLFLWNCCTRSLPVKERLRDRKVIEDSICVRCGCASESIIHCLLKCSYARQVWALSEVPFAVYNSELEDVEAWIKSVHSKSDAKEFGLFAVISWWIWFSRNKFIWKASDIQPLTLCAFAGNFFTRFQQSVLRNSSPKPNRALGSWSSPPNGYIKVNMDAACNNDGVIGIGLIARDCVGDCVGWRGITINLPLSPEASEAMAALRAVEFSLEKGWRNLIIEGDCLSVIQGISDLKLSAGVLGSIFEDIIVLAKDFHSFKALHVFREHNVAAHSLAKLASTGFVFSSLLPCSILEIVLSDSR
ncbi:hypothetical protein ACJIZ3_006538 [Penstemon smallii]|uniref:Uncharacterized protein n=1 Tax=Penstemon smallii TaxID=265156 RepID=A0ABD3S8H9_9LAMI